MRCTSPRTVGFKADGKTISWSSKTYSKEYASFQLPCGKCIECRLDYARQWAVRCVHEAQMHSENSFVTLTYSDEALAELAKKDGRDPTRLVYRDFQLFMKRLRFANPNRQIGIFVTGEYGEKTKRPHWHALIFGWEPRDQTFKRTNERGDQIFDSRNLSSLWGHGSVEVGNVTFESAGYCARYSAKKLVHGNDDAHDYQPISRKSSRNAIGKAWLDVYWRDVFNYGQVILPDGRPAGSIPRYYEKWLKQNRLEDWIEFKTVIHPQKADAAIIAAARDRSLREPGRDSRGIKKAGVTKNTARARIQKQKFVERLQKFLKL